jgi:hypothetical protein
LIEALHGQAPDNGRVPTYDTDPGDRRGSAVEHDLDYGVQTGAQSVGVRGCSRLCVAVDDDSIGDLRQRRSDADRVRPCSRNVEVDRVCPTIPVRRDDRFAQAAMRPIFNSKRDTIIAINI